MAAKTVDEYIAGLQGWQQELVAAIRAIVQEAAPEASESIKWAQPVYEVGGPFAYIKAHSGSVNFGFWRGVDLTDPGGLLEGTGDKMRHVKLAGMSDIRKQAFQNFVRQAIQLNQTKGDPTKAG
ncbi:MAG TPA: DUF1801 domain-containing protein [Anaerolineales bacterium]|nr:DUF1801 domain-containing protein [Anaerolineales bacterium]